MWKLMIFGILVQLVLLVSILDVNIFHDGGPSLSHKNHKPCLRNMMVITIEGLEYEDIVRALNSSNAVQDLMENTATYHVSSAFNNKTNSTDRSISGSIFDGKRLLYVGPAASPYEFNTSLWDFILINQERNETHNFKNHSSVNDTSLLDDQLEHQMMSYGSYMVNSRIAVDHMRRIVEHQRLDFYPMKFINIGRGGPSDEFLNEEERMWFFTKVYSVIRNAKSISNYVFVITSSMNMVVRNRTADNSNDTMLIFGHSECVTNKSRTPFFSKTITHDEAYSKLQGYVFLTSCTREVPKESRTSSFVVEGNLLELISGRALELQEMYTNFGLYYTGWETLNEVLTALDFMEIYSSPVVLACTVFIFFMWISFLAIKTMKLAVDVSQSVVEVNSTALKLINAICLALILSLCVAAKIAGCPCRYLIYITISVLVCRLLCGELFSSVRTYIDCSLMDKVKIGLQLLILIGVVECLFWSILYKVALIVVFAMVALGRVVQGALSAIQIKTIIGFSLATLFIGVQFLWPFSRFGRLINVNASASLWALGSVAAIAFLMNKSNHDRFVMFVGILELLMALSFANVFIIYGTSFYSVVPVIGIFVVISLILPLFGNADPKNRLLELATATAAVYVFFSCYGESFFLLSSFIVSFCSYTMDRATVKQLPDDDSYYINIFPATFHTVLLILACYVVTPAGGEAIMRAYTLLTVDSKYQLVASAIFYFTKLGFMVNLLEATFLSSGQKLMAVPNLFIVVIILNLVSFRAFIQYTMFSFEWGRKEVYVNQILLHVLAAMTFYLYSFAQVLCNTDLFSVCKKSKATYIPQEAVH